MHTSIVRTHAVAIVGMEGRIIDVETHVAPGLVAFNLVGLPDAGVKESKERVRAALQTCGIKWVEHRVTVNLSPAAIPKMGSGFDLAIAMGILALKNLIKTPRLESTVFVGELGLDGSVQPVRGVLPAVLEARRQGFINIVVPAQQAKEAQLVPGINVVPVEHLGQLVVAFGGKPLQQSIMLKRRVEVESPESEPVLNHPKDLSDVKGQNFAVEAMVTAAAGGHHLLLVGEPGSGKTMLAQRLPGILPPLEAETALEVTAIQSVAGRIRNATGLVAYPPLEAPHHSASMVAMVGGGTGLPQPGAVSLAHGGVLFLDEATEFAPKVLDALRQPLEQGEIHIHRAKAQLTFPARFQLILATNPCPCGYAISRKHQCNCSSLQRRRYLNRLSGPLLDRLDIQIPVVAPTVRELDEPTAYTSETALQKVKLARELACERWKNLGIYTNAQLPSQVLRSAEMGLEPEVSDLVRTALSKATMSLRGVDRALRVARTIADLRGSESVGAQDFGKALQYRTGVKNV